MIPLTGAQQEAEKVEWRKTHRCLKCHELVNHPKHRGITKTHDYEGPVEGGPG